MPALPQPLALCRLHFAEGGVLWTLFEAFELRLLASLRGLVAAGSVPAAATAVSEQEGRLRALYR